MSYSFLQHIGFLLLALVVFIACQDPSADSSQDSETICGGFLVFDSASSDLKKQIQYGKITVQSFTTEMVLKESVNLANSGYYFFPVDSNEPFILKISGPYGMSFEPEQIVVSPSEDSSIKEQCAKDINFKFLGFSVEGQVSTFGTNEGPNGVNLGLYNTKGELLQTTLTTTHGTFKFKAIYPQKEKYVIKPKKDIISMFDAKYNKLEFDININKTNYFERALIIKGYKLSGQVQTSEGKPMKNAIVMIYSHNATLVKDYSCANKVVPKGNKDDFKYNSLSPFCTIVSDSEGYFSFVNIPYGKFTVRAIYQNDYLSYVISPEEKEIDIKHQDFVIPEPFVVNTFSIFGKVKNAKGKGVPNVTIKINGQVKAVTDKNGIYVLENMKEGVYDLEGQKDDMIFEPLTSLQISPLLPNLQDLSVSTYKLCGQIMIEADGYSVSKRNVILENEENKGEKRIMTDQAGKYCFDVKPGKYKVYPVINQEEKNSDLHLQPESRDITIDEASINDANFYQSKVKVSGKIICLNKCDDSIKIKLINAKNDEVKTAEISKETFTFEFNNIFSGLYKLAIIKPEWCWENEDLEVKVQNADIKEMNFKQIGYTFLYSSQHDIEVEWSNVESKKNGTIFLDKTKDKTCLPQEGSYTIEPKSCYKYSEKTFSYDTKNINSLEFVPSEFRTNGKIEIDEPVLKLLKKNNITSVNVVIKIDEVDSTNQYLKKQYKNLNLKLKSQKENNFYFFTKPNTQFVITPVINTTSSSNEVFTTLLFISKDKKISVREECNEDPEEMKFYLKKGVIYKGKVTPPMEGIKITALTKSEKIIISTSQTDKNGNYQIGPLSSEEEYELKAEKEGFKLTKVDKSDFIAEKLSFLKIKTQDSNGKPLPGVILSLSSSEGGFSLNNRTNSEGVFNFIDLSSGEYYIKPLYKEYEFDDKQKPITIKGGEHIEQVLIAKRVAYSIFGKVNNLNKEKVEGLYVQAYNTKTKTVQETPIDKNGEYRLKGLIPNNTYSISIKIPSSSLIEKALPTSIPVTVERKDRTGVDFVVLQRSKTVDVRAYLRYVNETEMCPLSKAQNIHIEMSKPDEGDEHILKTVKLSNSCQFVFRNLQKTKYHFRVIEKVNTIEKQIYETTVDLSDERDISNGVKTLLVDIEKSKKNTGDNLNYTIYSPLFLFIMILVILKWDITVIILNDYILSPIQVVLVTLGLQKKRKIN